MAGGLSSTAAALRAQDCPSANSYGFAGLRLELANDQLGCGRVRFMVKSQAQSGQIRARIHPEPTYEVHVTPLLPRRRPWPHRLLIYLSSLMRRPLKANSSRCAPLSVGPLSNRSTPQVKGRNIALIGNHRHQAFKNWARDGSLPSRLSQLRARH
jgi:hypothetical protein